MGKTYKNSSKRENRHGQDRNSVSKRSYDKLKDDLYKSERKISDYKIDIEDLIEDKRKCREKSDKIIDDLWAKNSKLNIECHSLKQTNFKQKTMFVSKIEELEKGMS